MGSLKTTRLFITALRHEEAASASVLEGILENMSVSELRLILEFLECEWS